MRQSTTSDAIIAIVDDDASVREGLQKRMAEVGRDIPIVFLTKPLDEQKLFAVRAVARRMCHGA